MGRRLLVSDDLVGAIYRIWYDNKSKERLALAAPAVVGAVLFRGTARQVWLKVSSALMKKGLELGFAFLLCAASALEAHAGDVKAGAAVARECQACHGLDGLAKIEEAPNIAGQNELYLIKQLTAFKNGNGRTK